MLDLPSAGFLEMEPTTGMVLASRCPAEEASPSSGLRGVPAAVGASAELGAERILVSGQS